MSLVDSVYYPTMLLCLENTPLIRIWVECVSACADPWSKGAELLSAHTNGPSAHNVDSLRWCGENHSRGGCSPDFGVCMTSKFYSANSGKGEVFGTQTPQQSFLKKGWYWRQIRFTASKLNFCGVLYLNLKEFFFLFSFLCCWICKAAALNLCVLQLSLWRNNDLSVSYICVMACPCTQTVVENVLRSFT